MKNNICISLQRATHRQKRRKEEEIQGVQATRLPMGKRLKDANSASLSHTKATETHSGEVRPVRILKFSSRKASVLIDFQVKHKPLLVSRGKHPVLPLGL